MAIIVIHRHRQRRRKSAGTRAEYSMMWSTTGETYYTFHSTHTIDSEEVEREKETDGIGQTEWLVLWVRERWKFANDANGCDNRLKRPSSSKMTKNAEKRKKNRLSMYKDEILALDRFTVDSSRIEWNATVRCRKNKQKQRTKTLSNRTQKES